MIKKKGLLILLLLLSSFVFMVITASAEEQIKLRYQTTETAPTTVRAFEQIVADWNKLHPNVEIEFAGISWKDQYPKTMTGLAAGIAPEIIHFEPILSGPFFKHNLFLPMDDVVQEIEAAGFHFLPGTKENSNFKGVQYGVPLQIQGNIIWYRKDLFDKAGISPIETWDDWENAAKALTTSERFGTCIPAGRNLFTSTLFAQFLAQAGGRIFDDEGNVVLNSPEAAKALEFYARLAKYSPPGIGGYSFYEVYMSFVRNKSAIAPYWGRLLAVTSMENPSILPFTDNMLFPTPKPGGSRLSWNPVEYLTIPKTTGPKKRKWAKEFIKFWMLPKNYIRYNHSIFPNFMPPIKEIFEHPDFKKHPLFESHTATVQRLIETPIWDITFENPKLGFNPNIGVMAGELVLSDVVQRHLIKKQTVEEALSWGHKKIQSLTK